MNCNIKY
ncbi:hypothetical protein MAR_037160 [Mya arenaria]|nr:hypothetical protein MAR_037160 [Mya arenaria]